MRLVDTLRTRARARQHADPVHVGQRLLPRRAPRAARQGARLRALDPRAADHARPGRAGGRAPPPARDQRRPRADDPRGRRRQARQAAGRPLALPAARGPRARMGPRPADRGRTRREPARLRRDPHLPLRLRPARERRARALRPRARPVPAHEPAQRPRLRGRAGGAGAAPGAAVGVRGAQLPREAGRTARCPLVPCARVGLRRRDGDLPQRAPPAPRPRAPVRLAGRRPVAARADSDERRARRHAGPARCLRRCR